jgi:hypothetical protein
MRITQGGIYVMVEKYGIEGLLVVNNQQEESKQQSYALETKPEKDEAILRSPGGKSLTVKTFDRVRVEIQAQMVEYRRTVNLVIKPS